MGCPAGSSPGVPSKGSPGVPPGCVAGVSPATPAGKRDACHTHSRDGCATTWIGGDPDFLASYFALADSQKDAARFHSRWLVPLFFDALNNPDRLGDVFPPAAARVPYLNGGLFEDDPAPLHALDFPAERFRALLDFFGQYHFTIDENDPEDHEVGIDPEMLGHIFENLLEDNKDKGAYYTPKAIVSYMARQSLLHYLQTHLGEHPELAALLNEKDLTRLEKNGFVHQHAKRIAELLEAVKICDPAIGSGAFPIGLLHEILWTRLALDWTLNTPEDRARLKRQIIQNSIHGVDLDPGAVEIARLRFWLALVVDEDQPRPLPNLDYKIMQGDSLIESFEDIDLSHLHTEAATGHKIVQILGKDQTEMLFDDLQGLQELANRRRTHEISSLIHDYFGERVPEKKRQKHAEIDRLVLDHLRHCIGYAREGIEIQLHRLNTEHRTKARKVKGWKPDNREQKKVDLLNAQLAAIKVSGERLEALQNKAERPYLLWHLFFQNVFALGGFDIVIANPPYVSAIEHKKAVGEAQRDRVKRRFSAASGAWDLYVPFFQLGQQLLRPRGVLCLICPNKYLSASYASGLRQFIHAQLCLRTLADVSRVEIFTTASVYPVISLFSVEDQSAAFLEVLSPSDAARKSHNVFGYKSHTFEKNVLGLLPDLIWGYLLSSSISLLRKVLRNSTPLKHHADVNATTTAAEADVYGMCLLESRSEAWKVVNTGTIDPHRSLWGVRPLTHQGTQFDHPVLPTTTSSVSANRHALYSREKLIFAKMALRFEGFIDSDGTYAGLNVNCVHTSKNSWSLWALCALLHSKVIHHIYCQYFDALRMAGGYLPYQSPQVRTVPIPPVSDADKARLSQLAEACAAAAQRGDDETLAVHEAEIDQIVYRLFDLTPDEIALIESAPAPTREKKPSKRKGRKPVSLIDSAMSEANRMETIAATPESQSEQTASAPAKAFVPDELLTLEGELNPPKKAKAAAEVAVASIGNRSPAASASQIKAKAAGNPKTSGAKKKPVPISEVPRNEIMAAIRELFADGLPRGTETVMRELCSKYGWQRLSAANVEVLRKDLFTASLRRLIFKAGDQYLPYCRTIGDYDLDFLKQAFLAAIAKNGRVWHTRKEAIRAFARHLGFRRTGTAIEKTARSLINSLLREGKLEKDGADWIRRL